MNNYLVVFCLGVCLVVGVVAQSLTMVIHAIAVDLPHLPIERRLWSWEQYDKHRSRTKFIQFLLRSTILVFAIAMIVALLYKHYYANVIFMALGISGAVSYVFSLAATDQFGRTSHPQYSYRKEFENAS